MNSVKNYRGILTKILDLPPLIGRYIALIFHMLSCLTKHCNEPGSRDVVFSLYSFCFILFKLGLL
jgi:hypothetical protein